MSTAILALTRSGAERAARFARGDTTSLVDGSMADEARELLQRSDPDLMIVECSARDSKWLENAMALARNQMGPGTELKLVIDPDGFEGVLEEAVETTFAGWVISGVTVDGEVVAIHVTPRTDSSETALTLESLRGAARISSMLGDIGSRQPDAVERFEYESSLALSYLARVPRLEAEVASLRSQLAQAASREQETAPPSHRLPEERPVHANDRINQQDRPPTRSRAGKLAIAFIVSGLWVVAAWAATSIFDAGFTGFVAFIGLGALVAMAWDIRRRFIRLQRLTNQSLKLGRNIRKLEVENSRRLHGSNSIRQDIARVERKLQKTTVQSLQLEREHSRAHDSLLNEVGDIRKSVDTYSARLLADIPNREHMAKLTSSMVEMIRTDFSKLTRNVTTDLAKLYTQIEGNFRLRDIAEVTGPTPPLRGWASSPDLLGLLIEELLRLRPGLVVECGSGASTVWLALAAQSLGVETQIVALEHEDFFAEQTDWYLAECGVDAIAEVRLAPLRTTEVNNHVGPWYDLETIEGLTEIGLVLVDGPPGHLGTKTRYPALPVLRSQLAPAATVVLDDLIREEEKEITSEWRAEFPEAHVTEISLEKGAAVFRFREDD